MKRRFNWLLPTALTMLFCSCLKDMDSVEASSEASIRSFAISNMSVRVTNINLQGRDTTTYVRMSGAAYTFAIDQRKNLIYNTDSLPYGTQTHNLLLTISYDGSIFYKSRNYDGSMINIPWNSTDSIRLGETNTFVVQSADQLYTREYEVRINVRKQFPDSLVWHEVAHSELKVPLRPCAVERGDSIYLFGEGEDGKPTLSSWSCSGRNFHPSESVEGLEGGDWSGGVLLFKEKFYTILSGELYCSQDGKQWESVSTDIQFNSLVPFNQSSDLQSEMWALDRSGNLVCSGNALTWNIHTAYRQGMPDTGVTGVSMPLVSNPNIIRHILVGTDTHSAQPYATVWTRLSTESEWTEVRGGTGTQLPCPRLEGLTVINYDRQLFAFGGKSQEGYGKYEGFHGFFHSSDYGLTWRDCEEYYHSYSTWNNYMKFPKSLKNRNVNFTSAVDRHNYIWIITEDGLILRGAINRLAK